MYIYSDQFFTRLVRAPTIELRAPTFENEKEWTEGYPPP